MDTFYGGIPGQPSVVKAKFSSVEEMVKTFKLGETYKECWFGELAIIDTPNKNDPDNGKLFMRTFDYQKDSPYIYMGQIVGPSSGTPWFELLSMQELLEQKDRPLERGEDDNSAPWEERKFPGEDGEIWYDQTNADMSDPERPELQIKKFTRDGQDHTLIPGKTEDGRYNDVIQYSWVNIRQQDTNNDSWVYLGFTIPYLVIDYTHEVVAPYNEDGVYDESVLDITRNDDGSHPFWEEWNVDIPKGIHGDSIRNFKVIELTDAHVGTKIYKQADISYNQKTGAVQLGTPSYTVTREDAQKHRHIIVYELTFFDTYQAPSGIDIEAWTQSTVQPGTNKGVAWVYIGDFNMVDNVILDNNGTLTFEMSYDDDVVFDKKIKWINYVKLNTDNGQMTLDFNNTPGVDPDLTWWLRWVKDIKIDMETGTITFVYSNDGSGGNGGENQEVVIDAKLKLITSASVSENGLFTFGTNTKETITVMKTESPKQEFHIQHLKDMSLSTDDEYNNDKRIKVTYNHKDGKDNFSEYIGDPVNYVLDAVIDPADFHLLVLFNDPEHRITSEDASEAGVSIDSTVNDVSFSSGKWAGTSWRRRVFATGSTSPSPKDQWWRNYGAVKDDRGLLIGLNVSRETVKPSSPQDISPIDVINYLDKTYPQGLKDNTDGNGAPIRGKIVTFGDKDEEKWFFAYDYMKYSAASGGWYFLGRLTDSNLFDIMVLNGDSEPIPGSAHEHLQYGGIAMLKTTTVLYSDALPRFWSPEYDDGNFLDEAQRYLDALLDVSIVWNKTNGTLEEGTY